MLGVVKLVPDPKLVPPVNAAYQFMVAVPELEVAPKVTAPASQRCAGVVPVIEGVVPNVSTRVVAAVAVPNGL